MKIQTKDDRRVRIQLRQRKRIAGTKERPRLSVFRSVTHIYAQVIDDLTGQTLVSASSVDPALKGSFDKAVRGGNLKGAEAIGKAPLMLPPLTLLSNAPFSFGSTVDAETSVSPVMSSMTCA